MKIFCEKEKKMLKKHNITLDEINQIIPYENPFIRTVAYILISGLPCYLPIKPRTRKLILNRWNNLTRYAFNIMALIKPVKDQSYIYWTLHEIHERESSVNFSRVYKAFDTVNDIRLYNANKRRKIWEVTRASIKV